MRRTFSGRWRLIELGVERTSDKYRYPKAIKALKRLRDDYERAGDAAGFGVYLNGLRERQRRKYSFIAKLDVAFGTGALRPLGRHDGSRAIAPQIRDVWDDTLQVRLHVKRQMASVERHPVHRDEPGHRAAVDLLGPQELRRPPRHLQQVAHLLGLLAQRGFAETERVRQVVMGGVRLAGPVEKIS